jgi:type IV pilus assembly protein PilA
LAELPPRIFSEEGNYRDGWRPDQTIVTSRRRHMLRKLRERIQNEEKGFTLIELLVVVLIIGILAAIAIPAFLGQREKAQDGEAKSAVRNAASAAEAFYTDSQSYDGMTPATLVEIEPTLNDGVGSSLAVTEGDTTYTLTVTSETDNTFSITKDAEAGTTQRTCNTDGEAGCPANGSW